MIRVPFSVFCGIDRFCRLVVDPVRKQLVSKFQDPAGKTRLGEGAFRLANDKPSVVGGESLESGGQDPVSGMPLKGFQGRPRCGVNGFFWHGIEDPKLQQELLGCVVITDLKGFVGLVLWRVFHRGGAL